MKYRILFLALFLSLSVQVNAFGFQEALNSIETLKSITESFEDPNKNTDDGTRVERSEQTKEQPINRDPRPVYKQRRSEIVSTIPLTIRVNPSNARIRILNIGPKYYDGIPLESGRYDIEVSKSGYDTYREWFGLAVDNNKLNVQLIVSSAEGATVDNIEFSAGASDSGYRHTKKNKISQADTVDFSTPSPVQSNEPKSDTKTVIVEGMGVSIESASKNAGKAAVKQVVGMYVVSDTMVQNRELIRDEVLTNSNGYIESFKILEQSMEDGIYAIEAEVGVKIGQLTNRLGELNITTKKIATNEFKVKLDSKLTSANEFSSMLDKIVFDPIKEGMSVYFLKVDGLIVYESKMEERWFNAASSQQRDALLKSGDRTPFLLTFYMGFNDDYVSSVQQFFDSAAKKKSRGFKKHSPDTFQVVTIVRRSGDGISGNDLRGAKLKASNYSFNSTNLRKLTAKFNDLVENYKSELIISFIEPSGDEVAIVVIPGREYGKSLSDVPSSRILYQASKGWSDSELVTALLHRGITSSYAFRNSLFANRIKLGIVVGLTDEEARKIDTIKLDMRWSKSER